MSSVNGNNTTNGWAKIAVTAVVTALLTLLVQSWTAESKTVNFVQRTEFQTLCGDVQEMKKDIKHILELM